MKCSNFSLQEDAEKELYIAIVWRNVIRTKFHEELKACNYLKGRLENLFYVTFKMYTVGHRKYSTHRHSQQWVVKYEERLTKTRVSKLQLKTTLIVFCFNICDTFHHEYVYEGQKMTGEFHVSVLKRMNHSQRQSACPFLHLSMASILPTAILSYWQKEVIPQGNSSWARRRGQKNFRSNWGLIRILQN